MMNSKQKKVMDRLLSEKTIMCDSYDDYCIALSALCAGFSIAPEFEGVFPTYLKILFHDYCVLVAQGKIELYHDGCSSKKRKEFKEMVQEQFSALKVQIIMGNNVPFKEGEKGKISFDIEEIMRRDGKEI